MPARFHNDSTMSIWHVIKHSNVLKPNLPKCVLQSNVKSDEPGSAEGAEGPRRYDLGESPSMFDGHICFLMYLKKYLCLQELLNEARQRLVSVAKDPARYSALMDGLLLQVSVNTSL